MCREEVTAEAYPLHFAIAKAFKGTVEPFEQYQGPYVLTPKGKFWIQSHLAKCSHGHEHDTGLVQVYNERSETLSEPFPWYDSDAAIDAAEATIP